MKKIDIASIIGMIFLISIWSILPPKISNAEQPIIKQEIVTTKDIDTDINKLLTEDIEFNKHYVLQKKQEFLYRKKLEKKVKKQEFQIKKLNLQLDTLLVFAKIEECNCDSIQIAESKKTWFKKVTGKLFNKD